MVMRQQYLHVDACTHIYQQYITDAETFLGENQSKMNILTNELSGTIPNAKFPVFGIGHNRRNDMHMTTDSCKLHTLLTERWIVFM